MITEHLLAVVNTYSSSSNGGSLAGPFLGGLVGYVITAILLSRVFKKAGRPSWPAWVPVYSNWVLLELGGRSGANVFWLFLPFVGAAVYFVQFLRASLVIGRAFGKSDSFSVLGLVLFAIVGYAIIAFDSSTYDGGNTLSGGPVPLQPVEPQYPQVSQPPQAPPTPPTQV